tara:strand:- start:1046 stop:1393 length:348 start_codon:yes stop_codon:yes gene_type:complete
MSPSDSSTIAALNSELQRATIMDPEAMPPNVVTMNSTVRFVIKPGGMIAELQLVYPKDVPDHESNVVSVTSPMGTALLGLAEGQSIDWVLAGGHTISIRVVEIIFQPELYGRYHL